MAKLNMNSYLAKKDKLYKDKNEQQRIEVLYEWTKAGKISIKEFALLLADHEDRCEYEELKRKENDYSGN